MSRPIQRKGIRIIYIGYRENLRGERQKTKAVHPAFLAVSAGGKK
jgi:hypothetical protein